MRTRNSTFAWTCLTLMALIAPAAVAGDQPESARRTPRCLAYFANYHQDASLVADLALLADACERGAMTHVIVGLFHCDWRDRSVGRPSGGCISLNGTYLNDPKLQPIWQTVALLRSKKVKVIASFGGGGVGDYGHLLDPAQPEWYPLLRDALKAHGFDGLDMDIEESKAVVDTANVKRILKKLRKDFGEDFIVTSAPVASALTGGSNISPGIDYAALIRKGWFTWYNLQFYNGFGDLLGEPYGSTDYETVLRKNKGVSPRRFVAGVPTNPASAECNYHDLSALAPKLRELAGKHPAFGGVYGWTYQEALVDGKLDPVGWARGVAAAMGIPAAAPAGGAPRAQDAPARETVAPAYTFRYLGDFGGMPAAINSAGDVAGWDTDLGTAFLIPAGGSKQDLGTFPGGHGSQAAAINSAGDVVGSAVDANFDVGAFLVARGQAMADLGDLLGGREREALAVNDSGGIVGWSTTPGASPQPHAFLRSPDGQVSDLGTLDGGAASWATAVNEYGDVVGGALDASGALRAFVLPGGSARMTPLPFSEGVRGGVATALDRGSRAVGWASTPWGFDGFTYDATRGPCELDLFGTRLGSQAGAAGMNARGKVVGWYLDGEGACRAFLLDLGNYGCGAVPADLEGLVQNPPPGDALRIATAVNDGGSIVGQTATGRPFLLTPAP